MHKSLTKDEINQLPLFKISCKITVIDNEADCVNAIKILQKEEKLGFDTESKPVFKKGQHSNVSLLQLSTHSQVFLFRINLIGLHPQLIDILESPTIVKTGVAINGDLKELKELAKFNEHSFVEIADLAKKQHFKSQGLRSLTASLFGQRISKGSKLSNWELKHLSKSQINYAATDAWIGLQIYDKLISLQKSTKQN